MIDREKVIKGLEHEISRASIPTCGTDFIDCVEVALLRDALALLKAQEPVEPKIMYFVDEGLTWETYEVPTCGVCGALLGDALFCPMCGRTVKRND